jgi:hypothetical protein
VVSGALRWHRMSAISGVEWDEAWSDPSKVPLAAPGFTSWAAKRFCATSGPPVVLRTSPTSTCSSPVRTCRRRSPFLFVFFATFAIFVVRACELGSVRLIAGRTTRSAWLIY